MNRTIPAMPQDTLSLGGKRIVITRARSQAQSLARAIEERGGEVIEFPTIEIQPAAHAESLDEAIKNLERYDWLMFTSANGVEIFCGAPRSFQWSRATACGAASRRDRSRDGKVFGSGRCEEVSGPGDLPRRRNSWHAAAGSHARQARSNSARGQCAGGLARNFAPVGRGG